MSKTKTSNTKKDKKDNKRKTMKSKSKPIQSPKKDEAVVLVYANWCPHCQTMKPEWNELKNKLGSVIETIEIEDSDFDKDLKMMDIENNKLNNERIEIIGYPTLFKIRKGHADYYGGDRTASEMYKWVMRKEGGYNKSKIRSTNKSKSKSIRSKRA